jgi:4-hydroxythreonine-4-phosphate dehydrogenase
LKIIISIGDCNGIGIEVMAKAINELSSIDKFQEVKIDIAGKRETLKEYLDNFDLPVQFEGKGVWIGRKHCEILECNTHPKIYFGNTSHDAGKLAAESLELACDNTIAHHYDAIVTMPISKYSMYSAGWNFTGHTEYLAFKCGTQKPLMILCTDEIRIALATTHIPIKVVPESISVLHLAERISALHNSLVSDFKISSPKIAVLSLNPHAGENATMGTEERDIILPAIERSSFKGIYTEGPFPPDGFFGFETYKTFDGILAMYHDQGLIPLKLISKGSGVNFTAGIPFIRTSPDHGTAFDVAGKGVADSRSTVQAIQLAIQIAENHGISD